MGLEAGVGWLRCYWTISFRPRHRPCYLIYSTKGPSGNEPLCQSILLLLLLLLLKLLLLLLLDICSG